MESSARVYNFFYTMLKVSANRWGKKFQSFLVLRLDKTPSLISRIMSGKTKASFNMQVEIANALGYEYWDFLKLGKQIVEGKKTKISFDRPEKFDEDSKIDSFVKKTIKILKNGGKSAKTLEQNIEEAYKSIEMQEKIAKMEAELERLNEPSIKNIKIGIPENSASANAWNKNCNRN